MGKQTKLRVVELFAGVGGFRVGLDRASKGKRSHGFETIWSNQWEPSTKKQHASDVYIARFGAEGHCNEDICKVPAKDIPKHDLLVGGFPCQDYSVARTLSQATGLQGKKGVLWWEIYRIISDKKHLTPFLFLENVDRLLKSPASARGRDFAIILSSLAKLGYVVEWRVINAAEYGKPQRRKRTFILGYRKGTSLAKEARKYAKKQKEWLTREGVAAEGFRVKKDVTDERSYDVGRDPARISADFSKLFPHDLDFQNSGLMIDGKVYTARTTPDHQGDRVFMKDILQAETVVPEAYFIPTKDMKTWKYLKGAKNEKRKSKSGFEYAYTEGAMVFPDPLDRPSRTIITAEGGSTPSRFKHVIKTASGKYRRLTPLELERLCQFPDDHTKLEGVPDTRRAFFMGNALVVGIIEDMGRALLSRV